MRVPVILLFLFASAAYAFDPIAYLHKEHDRMFFGVGGGCFYRLAGRYADQFSGVSFKRILLQAGVGDYPFVFDARYCATWATGRGGANISGTGAGLNEYQVMPGLRTYLFWKHPHVRSYFLSSLIGSQEKMVSSRADGTDELQFTDGVRYGFLAGLGLDLIPADFHFADLEIVYQYERSDLFQRKEMMAVNVLYNIGR